MKRSKNIVTIVSLLTVFVFVISIYALTFQVIGDNTPNKATIFSGVLSMLGGIFGALGAYFIARMQMTKQLDLQYKKERQKMILEININKHQEVVTFIHELKRQFIKFEREYGLYNAHLKHKVEEQDENEIDMMDLIESIDIKRYFKCMELLNEIIGNYNTIFTFKVFFRKEFTKELEDIDQSLRTLEDELRGYMLFHYMRNNKYSKAELKRERKENEEIIHLKLLTFKSDLNIQLEYIEVELYNLLLCNQ